LRTESHPGARLPSSIHRLALDKEEGEPGKQDEHQQRLNPLFRKPAILSPIVGMFYEWAPVLICRNQAVVMGTLDLHGDT
jgi:hypothetical protein